MTRHFWDNFHADRYSVFLDTAFEETRDNTTNINWMTNENGQRFFELIRESKISIVLSHGISYGGIVVNPAADEYGELVLVDADDICALPQGYFNSCELIMVICCYGGNLGLTDDEGFSLSLAEAFADRGAKRVVSVYGSFLQQDAKMLLENFFTYPLYIQYDNVRYRGDRETPTYIGALTCAIGMTFSSRYYDENEDKMIYPDINILQDDRIAYDGTTLNMFVYYANDARVATMIGDGDFNETFNGSQE